MVKSCEIIKDWKTGKSLQFGFIHFEKEESVPLAIEGLNDKFVDGQRVKLDYSHSYKRS